MQNPVAETPSAVAVQRESCLTLLGCLGRGYGLACLDVGGMRGRDAASVSSLGPQLDSCCLGAPLGVEIGKLVEQRAW